MRMIARNDEGRGWLALRIRGFDKTEADRDGSHAQFIANTRHEVPSSWRINEAPRRWKCKKL